MRFALILSLLIAIAAVVFAIYNPDPVQLQLAGYALTAPLAVVIIVTLLAGVLAGILASVPSVMRRGAENRRLRKRVDELGGGPVHAAGTTQTAEPLPRRPRESTPEREAAANAAETERLAAETERMAAEAQRRAAELERQQRSSGE